MRRPRHPEIPLLADVILASDDAVIRDSGHFRTGLVPGDGVHVVFPMLMGMARARYFLITSQAMSAQEALQAGLVNEVLPRERLLGRAREHAEDLMKQPRFARRYARLLLTQPIKEEMQRHLGFGLALEGLARMKEDL